MRQHRGSLFGISLLRLRGPLLCHLDSLLLFERFAVIDQVRLEAGSVLPLPLLRRELLFLLLDRSERRSLAVVGCPLRRWAGLSGYARKWLAGRAVGYGCGLLCGSTGAGRRGHSGILLVAGSFCGNLLL